MFADSWNIYHILKSCRSHKNLYTLSQGAFSLLCDNILPPVISMRGRRQRGSDFDHGGRSTKRLLPTCTCTDIAVPPKVHHAELLANQIEVGGHHRPERRVMEELIMLVSKSLEVYNMSLATYTGTTWRKTGPGKTFPPDDDILVNCPNMLKSLVISVPTLWRSPKQCCCSLGLGP